MHVVKFVYVDLQLEQKLDEVERFYSSSNTKVPNTLKGDKFHTNFKKRQQDAASREVAAAQRMQDLMRQFGTILRQVPQYCSNAVLSWSDDYTLRSLLI